MRFWKRRLRVLRFNPEDTLLVDAGPNASLEQAYTIQQRFAEHDIDVVVMSGLTIVGVRKGP